VLAVPGFKQRFDLIWCCLSGPYGNKGTDHRADLLPEEPVSADSNLENGPAGKRCPNNRY
jgi:hypothetical protein